MPSRRLVIIDGYSLLFRAFYGTRYLSTSDGRPTNALFGLVTMLLHLYEKVQPDAMVVALDAHGKTFRHAEFAEYKGTRRETPQELISQLDASRELLSDLNIPSVELIGYEADDVAGTISRLAEENDYETYIVTGDLDSLQLVDQCVSVMTTQRGVSEVKVYDPAAVMERYGFGPEHVADFKSMAGDTSDNIPGVPGIGEKTATYLIQKFGHVESMLERLDEVEEKYRKKIEPNIEILKKSKWLATIDRHVPLAYDFKPYSLSWEQFEHAKNCLMQWEFRSQVRRLESVLARYIDGASSAPAASVNAEPVRAILHEGYAGWMVLSPWVGSEPYALFAPPGSAQGSMFGDEAVREAYVAVGVEVRKTSYETALRLVKERPGQLVAHDTKPWVKQAAAYQTPRFDVTLASYVLQSGRTSYDIGDIVQGFLEVQTPESPEQKAVTMLMLEKPLRERLELEQQTRVFQEVELALVPVLAEMEAAGITLDSDILRDFSKSLQTTITQTQQKIYEMAGCEFNIGSPKQIGEVLFEKMAIPGQKKTKTGYATGVEILGELAATYPIAGEILTYRELTKLKSTYADSLPKLVAEDGRIHTTFNQTVAATGRLSSIDPNLQNIPIRTELGRQIRKAFVAAPGTILGSFDYSQIELRILAHYCHDEPLVEAFRTGIDVHTVTAALMFHVDKEAVTKEQRRLAKMLNYAVLYGVTDFGLANQLGAGFGVAEARELIRQYNERFPKVREFTLGVVEEARSKGFTTTLLGRRRYFSDIHAGNRSARLYAERQAINAPMQGTAADMIKLAMIEVRKLLGTSGTRMLLQVHDELVFEMTDDRNELMEPIRGLMENALPLDVPVEVDAKTGTDWLGMSAVSRP
jgi:DNA polymerase-1